MKSVKILALAFGLILITTAASFGQVVFTAGSSANQIAPNAQTGLAGSISLFPTSQGSIPMGESMNISYSPYAISSLSELTVTVDACVFTGFTAYNVASPTQTCGGATVAVTVALNSVTITVSGANVTVPAPATLIGPFIQINGVRLDVAAQNPAVDSQITAFLSSNQGLATTTNPNPTVGIIKEPITLALTTAPTAVLQVGGSTTATVTISEAGSFTNAFETKGATSPTQLVLAVNPPAGFTLTGATLGTLATGVTAAIPAANVTANKVIVNITGQNSSLLDSIPVILAFTSTVPAPLTPGSATVTATLAPPVTATMVMPYIVSAAIAGDPLRYASRPVPSPALSISFGVTQTQTTLYSVFSAFTPGFNTGFAVANPTGVLNTATTPSVIFNVGQPGNITVKLVPNDGSASKTLVTSAAFKPGLGLDPNGLLQPGAEWSVLLSELATSAGFSSFQGQVFFITNFSDAHGVNFIADPTFSVQSQGFPMLVVGSGLNN